MTMFGWIEAHAQLVLILVTAAYVCLTAWVVREMRRQNALVREQIGRALRPLAVIQRETVPGGWEYVVKNLGPGVALDIVYVQDKGSLGGKPIIMVHHLGALPSGSSVNVPADASSELSNYATTRDLGHEVPRHLVFARPISADHWMVTSNTVQSGGGHVQPNARTISLSSREVDEIASIGARDYIERRWPEIKSRLLAAGMDDADR